MSVASSQFASAGRSGAGRAARRVIARVALAACVGACFWSVAAVAQAASFSYTGGEQTYTVPAGVSSVQITAIGGGGGRPPDGSGLPAGRGAVVTGIVAVTPGQVLYVYVGSAGGLPGGGFNGGGAGGSLQEGGMAWGGGGASDVSTVARPHQRLAGVAGDRRRGRRRLRRHRRGRRRCRRSRWLLRRCRHRPVHGSARHADRGGAGGCNNLGQGCGGSGSLGRGGDGGASGTAEDARVGSGGGGGLYGGGGGAGHVVDTGAGAGGSSMIPAGGSVSLAPLTTPTGVEIAPYTPPARCADGLDNDGDRLTDFAADPGCSSATDDDEANPFVPTQDKVAPTARLTGPRTQKLARTVAATVKLRGGRGLHRFRHRQALDPRDDAALCVEGGQTEDRRAKPASHTETPGTDQGTRRGNARAAAAQEGPRNRDSHRGRRRRERQDTSSEAFGSYVDGR